MAKGDSKAKGKSDRPTRRPKQKGKVKKALQHQPGHAFQMRTKPPVERSVITTIDSDQVAETNKLQNNGVSPALARNVAAWRKQRNVL